MDPLTLGLIAVLGFAALKLRQKRAVPAAAAPPPPAPPPPPEPQPRRPEGPEDLANKINQGLGLVDDFIPLAGAFGVSAGTVGLYTAGVAVAAAGTYAASRGGAELDKALGGTGGGLTGTVAQIGAGSIFAYAWLAGPLAGLWATMASAVFYGIVTIIDDTKRLAHGQAGATADMKNEWRRIHTEIHAKISEAHPDWKNDWVHRFSIPFADGYVQRWNRLLYTTWMRKPRGVGVDDRGHAIWGRDRAHFVGDVGPTGQLVETFPYEHLKPEFATQYALAEDIVIERYEADTKLADGTIAPKGSPKTIIPKERNCERRLGRTGSILGYRQVPNPDLSEAGYAECAAKNWEGNAWKDAFKPCSVSEPIYEEVMMDFCAPPVVLQEMGAGSAVANSVAYVRWMKSEWGAFQTAESHAKVGLAEGRFQGVVREEGKLEADSNVYDWRDK